VTPVLAAIVADTARDNNAPLERRLQALGALHGSSRPQARAIIEGILEDKSTPAALRENALQRLIDTSPGEGVKKVLSLASSAATERRMARAAAVDNSSFIHLSSIDPAVREEFHSLLKKTATDREDPALAVRATIALASIGDEASRQRLRELLKSALPAGVSRAETLTAMSATADTIPSILEALKKALQENDEETSIVALRLLAGDVESRVFRLELIDTNPLAGPRVQQAALRSVMSEAPEVLELAIRKVEEDGAPARPQFAGAFRVALESQGPFKPAQLSAWKARVVAVINAAGTTAELKLALDMTVEVLDRLAGP
jgi:hypothetical protein